MGLIEKSMEKCEPRGRIIPLILKKRKLLFVLVLGIFTTLFLWTFSLKLALAAEKELPQNPGFEEGFFPWQGSLAAISLDKNVFHSGKSSARITQEARSTWIPPLFFLKWRELTQFIPVKPNRTYQFSAWVKTENASATHFKALWYDEKEQWLSQAQFGGGEGTKDWFFRSGVATAPPTAVSAQVCCMGGWSLDGKNPGISWFDDISVKEVESQKEADFSFEEVPK